MYAGVKTRSHHLGRVRLLLQLAACRRASRAASSNWHLHAGHNRYVLYLSSFHQIAQQHADRAIANLERFSLVLALEKLDPEAWELLQWTMNLTTATPMAKAKAGTNFSTSRHSRLRPRHVMAAT